MARARPEEAAKRPVLYQVCRAGDRFEVGDGPFDLSRLKALILGRGAEGGYDARATEDVIRVDDPWMSSRHASIQRDVGGGRFLQDEGSTNGVMVNGKQVDRVRLENGDLIETGRTFWLYLTLPMEPAPPVEPAELGRMASWSPSLAEQLTALRKAAEGTDHILLLGEPGVGKSFAAKVVHEVSGRPGRLVTVDCGALAKERMPNELFGAQDVRAGALGISTGGTLFLHRVEHMPMELQAAISGVLETSRVAPLNGGRAVPVDLRVVASAETDLEAAARKGRFARSLLDQLSALVVTLPPLRDRREDLGLLIDALLARAGGARAVSRDACRALLNYRWPRNIRELSKVLEGGAILAGDDEHIDLRHLPGVIAGRSGVSSANNAVHITGEVNTVAAYEMPPVENTDPGQSEEMAAVEPTSRVPFPEPSRVVKKKAAATSVRQPRISRDGVDEREVVAALKRAKGNVIQAARAMGKARADFQRLMEEFGLDAEQFR
ncbi:MAG: sigma 54-interacting transcriptional regulator [Myxococcota bacterium]